jgi:hypothetical protein
MAATRTALAYPEAGGIGATTIHVQAVELF